MALKIFKPSQWNKSVTGNIALSLDNSLYDVLNADQSWSFSSPDDDTLRFEVRAGDKFWWDAANSDFANRSEVADKTIIANGAPLDISYKFNIEPGAANTAYWNVIGQLHQDNYPGALPWPPPFDISLKGEKMCIDINYSGADGNPVGKMLWVDVGDIVRGHFYDMEIKAIVDPSGTGRLVVIRDGVTLVDYSGPIGYAQEGGVYWKEGIYRSDNAKETMVANYKGLHVATGTDITFPSQSDFIAAPVFGSTVVAPVASDGSRIVTVTGTAKAGTTVSIFENGARVGSSMTDATGRFTVSVKEGDGQHLLSAVARDASGRNGLTSVLLAVEIGTAAAIVSRLDAIAAENVGAIVLTDTSVLPVTTQNRLHSMMKLDASALAKIQGGYSFLLTTSVTGQSYNRQTESYTAAGVVTERIRYAGTKLVFLETIAQDKSTVVKTINGIGGFDVVTTATDGFNTSFARNAANGIPTFTQTFGRDGSKSIYYYNAAGQQTTYTLTAADKSNVTVNLGITGQAYAIQAFGFNSSGSLILQERFTAAGVKLSSQQWNSDGSRETHNFSATTQRETSFTITYANGTSLQGQYGISGKPYTASVSTFSNTGKLTGQTTSNALGSIPPAESFLVNALSGSARVSSLYDASTGLLTGSSQTNADGSSLVTTFQPGSSSLPNTVKYFNAAGTLTETQTFNAGGQKVSVDVFNSNGSDYLTTYDPSTSTVKSFTQTNADRSRVVGVYNTESSTLASRSTYDPSGKLVELDLYNSGGALVSTNVFNPDGSDLLTKLSPGSGVATESVQTSPDGLRVITTYRNGSSSIPEMVQSYDTNGALTKTDLFNMAGQRISSDIVSSDGSDVTTTFDSSTGLATNSTQKNVDGSRVVTIYHAGSSMLASRQTYAATGNLTKVDGYDPSGQQTSADIFASDGSHVLTTYDPTTGSVTSTNIVMRSAFRTLTTYDPGSLGSLGRVTSVSSFNASGVLVAAESWGSDGSHKVYGFDARTGLKNGSTVTAVDGSQTVTNFAPGNEALTSLLLRFDGAGRMIESDNFDTSGRRINANLRFSDGSRSITTFDPANGAVLQATTYNADKTRTEVNNAIVGKPHAQQTATYDVAGKLVSMVRTYGDAQQTVAFTQNSYANGASEAHTFDTAGREVSRVVTASDGSRDAVTSTYGGSGSMPTTVVQDHFGSNSQRLWTDTTNADGSHKQIAAAAGASLTSHAGVADTFTSASAGADSFVFKPAFGQDIITNFHAGAAANHDTIDLTAFHIQLGAGQSSLTALGQALKQVNRDAVLTLTPTDTITLKNTLVATLTRDNFLV